MNMLIKNRKNLKTYRVTMKGTNLISYAIHVRTLQQKTSITELHVESTKHVVLLSLTTTSAPTLHV